MSWTRLGLLLCAGCAGGDDAPDPLGPPTRVAASTDAVTVAYPDVVWTPDGTLYVSWVELDADDVADVLLARSTDGGRTFEPPVLVDDVDTLFLGTVRQPVLAADDERVAITVGGGSYLESSILLYVAPARTLRFEGHVLATATLWGGTGGTDETLVDQPELVFADGELWVHWKRGTRNESFSMVLGRERDGWAAARLEDGIRGQPCECCPSDFWVEDDGEILLGFRNNDQNLREIFVAVAPPGGDFATSYQVSDTAWEIGGCPFDGPSLTATPDGALLATWADASAGDSYQWFAVSSDRGRTWSPSARLEPANESSMTWPTAVTGPDGAIWSSVVEILHQTNVHVTRDLGATWTAVPVDAPTGPLFWSELAAGPDGVALVGLTDAGELWLLRPDQDSGEPSR